MEESWRKEKEEKKESRYYIILNNTKTGVLTKDRGVPAIFDLESASRFIKDFGGFIQEFKGELLTSEEPTESTKIETIQ